MKQQDTPPRLVALALLSALLSACSLFYTDNRPEVQYQRADSAGQLIIPPDLSGPQHSAGFVVAGVDKGKIQRNMLLPVLDEVRFERAGDLAWLTLSSPPETLWVMVRQFIEREGYLLQHDKPLEGYMQTTWAEEQLAVPRAGFLGVIDKTLELIRPTESLTTFVFRFERSGDGGTRLFVDHRTISEQRIDTENRNEDGEYAFRDAERDPELAARMLTRLLVYFGIEVQRAKGILSEAEVAQLGADAYIEREENAATALVIAKTYPLAWDEVEEALENLYFDIDDDDFDNGRFEVSYSGEAFTPRENTEEKGFFASLGNFFSSNQDKVRQYQVYLGDRPGGTRVSLSDDNGEQLNAEEELAILNAIRLQLTS